MENEKTVRLVCAVMLAVGVIGLIPWTASVLAATAASGLFPSILSAQALLWMFICGAVFFFIRMTRFLPWRYKVTEDPELAKLLPSGDEMVFKYFWVFRREWFLEKFAHTAA